MSRNVKEIGKELMGKSLNSYHRKTGLTQLEKNNEMQDGILNGILSQVDDAYIEKTEQSNVIHLDGSDDGVVVVDSIEGNTLVNLGMSENFNKYNMIMDGCKFTRVLHSNKHYGQLIIPMDKLSLFKSGGKYKIITNITKNTLVNSDEGSQKAFQLFTYNYSNHAIESSTQGLYSLNYDCGEIGIKECVVTMKDFNNPSNPITQGVMHFSSSYYAISGELEGYIIICEYNEDIVYPTTPFNGLQSSFEEKVNNEGKYEIEILSQNRNLIDKEYFAEQLLKLANITREKFDGKDCLKINGVLGSARVQFGTNDNEIKTLRISAYTNVNSAISICHYGNYLAPSFNSWSNQWGKETYNYVDIYNYENRIVYIDLDSIQVEYGDTYTNYIPRKSNKIKLLINEPLRNVHNSVKDRLCIRDNKLVVERNTFEIVFNGTEPLTHSYTTNATVNVRYQNNVSNLYEGSVTSHICDRFTNLEHWYWMQPTIGTHCKNDAIFFNVPFSWLSENTVNGVKQYLSNQYNNGTPMKVVHILNSPIYEEVTNEYGEPIILEGYENGTLYIDSTIAPTTTVRYTPKMESFKTLNEVNNNNIMLTSDINDTIIPYMMEVDLMIMEKEVALMSQKNIRKIGAEDMTSMQKRTGEMLERLIKGKTLTEKECKTRVTVYLNANKITDEQAEELILLISEIYA